MYWFEGTIRNSIDEAKATNNPLLVFINGDDNISQSYETFLNDGSKLKSNNFVAVKISHDSVMFKQFKAIYNTVPVPSVFLIGTNGIPFCIVCSEITSEGLHNAINDGLEKHEKTKLKKQINDESHKNGFLSTITESNVETNSAENSSLKSGIDDETVQLSQDKIHKRINEIRSSPRFLLLKTLPVSPPLIVNERVPLSARIQFRLPTNERPSWEFPNMSTLHDVRLYVADKMKIKSSFKLVRTYPRVSFTPEDENKTLVELSLTPTATLIVVPVQDEAVQAKMKKMIAQPNNIIFTLITSIMQPILNIFSYLRNYLFGRQQEDETNDNSARRTVSDSAVEKRFNKKTSTTKIHGFRFDKDSDSDSDMNTDNGNSTQQQ